MGDQRADDDVLGAILALQEPGMVAIPAERLATITRFGGRVAESQDDRLIATFETAEQAALACVALIEGPDDMRPGECGIGLHIDRMSRGEGMPREDGCVVVRGLCQIAGPGGACFSRIMHDAVADKLNVTFGPVEEGEIEGRSRPVPFLRVVRFVVEAASHGDLDTVGSAEPANPAVATETLTGFPAEPDVASHVDAAPPSNASIRPSTAADPEATLVWRPVDQGRTTAASITRELSTATVEACEQRAARAAAMGKIYAAVAALDEAIALAGFDPSLARTRQRLEERRMALTAPLWFDGNAIIEDVDRDVVLLPGKTITIGRPTQGSGVPDIAIGFKLLSRATAGLHLRRSAGALILDRGEAANSVFLDERPLAIGESSPLDRLEDGMCLALGGVDDPPAKGDCRLLLCRAPGRDDAVTVRIALDHLDGVELRSVERAWPGARRDARRIWVIMGRSVSVGGGAEAIVPLSESGTEPCARIHHGPGGYQIEADCDSFRIDDAVLRARVPLRDGAVLSGNGRAVTFRSVDPS